MAVDPWLMVSFLPVAALIGGTPGPDMAYCVGQGMRGGPRAVLIAAASLSVGAFAGVALAGYGVAAAVDIRPGVLTFLRWIGAGFLLWLAYRVLTGERRADTGAGQGTGSNLAGGVAVSLSNPKGAGLSLALIPPFIDPSMPLLPQFLILGGVLAAFGFAANVLAGLLAGRARHRFAPAGRVSKVLRFLTACIFGALALRIVTGGRA